MAKREMGFDSPHSAKNTLKELREITPKSHASKKKVAGRMGHKEVAKHLELSHGNPKYHEAMKTYLGMKPQDRDSVIKANKDK